MDSIKGGTYQLANVLLVNFQDSKGCKKIEAMRAAFFWKGRRLEERGHHPIAWKHVCRSKVELSWDLAFMHN